MLITLRVGWAEIMLNYRHEINARPLNRAQRLQLLGKSSRFQQAPYINFETLQHHVTFLERNSSFSL